MEHSEAEMFIGMKQHGALEGAQAVALEEHLAGCAGCRAFFETTHAMEGTLAMNATTAVQSMSPDELARNVQRRIRDSRALAWLGTSYNPWNLPPRAQAALVGGAWAALLGLFVYAAVHKFGAAGALAGLVHVILPKLGRDLLREPVMGFALVCMVLSFATAARAHRRKASALNAIRNETEFRTFLEQESSERKFDNRWHVRAVLLSIGVITLLGGLAYALGMPFDRAHSLGLAAGCATIVVASVLGPFLRERRALRNRSK